MFKKILIGFMYVVLSPFWVPSIFIEYVLNKFGIEKADIKIVILLYYIFFGALTTILIENWLKI